MKWWFPFFLSVDDDFISNTEGIYLGRTVTLIGSQCGSSVFELVKRLQSWLSESVHTLLYEGSGWFRARWIISHPVDFPPVGFRRSLRLCRRQFHSITQPSCHIRCPSSCYGALNLPYEEVVRYQRHLQDAHRLIALLGTLLFAITHIWTIDLNKDGRHSANKTKVKPVNSDIRVLPSCSGDAIVSQNVHNHDRNLGSTQSWAEFSSRYVIIINPQSYSAESQNKGFS